MLFKRYLSFFVLDILRAKSWYHTQTVLRENIVPDDTAINDGWIWEVQKQSEAYMF